MKHTVTTVVHTVTTGGASSTISEYWIPIAIAVLGGLVTYYVAARNVYINSITVERSKWIDKLRNNLAAYDHAILEVVLFGSLSVTSGARYWRSVAKSKELGSLIKLQLNPDGDIDKNLLTIISMGPATTKPKINIHLWQYLLVRHSQYLLKAEWERVKYEASGPYAQIRDRNKAKEKLAEYNRYANDEGDPELVFFPAEANVENDPLLRQMWRDDKKSQSTGTSSSSVGREPDSA